jgi:hypothetical protein
VRTRGWHAWLPIPGSFRTFAIAIATVGAGGKIANIARRAAAVVLASIAVVIAGTTVVITDTIVGITEATVGTTRDLGK